jgi:hypothetical protein
MFDWMLLVIALIAAVGAGITYWRAHHRNL